MMIKKRLQNAVMEGQNRFRPLYFLSHILLIAISFLLAVDPAQEFTVIGKAKKYFERP